MIITEKFNKLINNFLKNMELNTKNKKFKQEEVSQIYNLTIIS